MVATGLDYDIDHLRDILLSRESPCSQKHWFSTPDCAQVAADTFDRPIVVHGSVADKHVYVPLQHVMEPGAPVIVLRYVDGGIHIIWEEFGDRELLTLSSLADLNPQHIPICRRRGWVDGFKNIDILYPL